MDIVERCKDYLSSGGLFDPDLMDDQKVSGLVMDCRNEIERLRQQNAELVEALQAAHSWIDRWTNHVSHCSGGLKCDCGRTVILYNASSAIAKATGGE